MSKELSGSLSDDRLPFLREGCSCACIFDKKCYNREGFAFLIKGKEVIVMQLLVLVLNKIELLEELLSQLSQGGIHGATILQSTGMATTLAHSEEDVPMFRTLSKILNPDREESRTVLMVLKKDQVDTAKKIINDVTGGISKPNTGILFALPIDFVEGMVEE